MKRNKKYNWKAMGLNMNNFEEVYNRYINTILCDYCAVTLTYDTNKRGPTATQRCLDHCHTTGNFRAVLCNLCNTQRVTDI